MSKKKDVLKLSFRVVKKIANSNKYTKKIAKKAKNQVISYVQNATQREVYNLSSYYPTIEQYYFQQLDIKSTDPLISILLPAYNTPESYLRECIESIIVQSYPKWELCIADDNSSDKSVVRIIDEYIKKDKRIKLVKRPKNGHISKATNSALEIAKGDFVSLMDHDDILWPNALYETIVAIRNNPSVDLIYSDEDKIDGTGKLHSYPFLKPDFSPEFLESCNYITHFSTIRRTLMNEIGGFRAGYEGAQDWDLFIRIGEKTNHIIHLPKILYSWRIHENSTASDTDAKPYVYEAQRKLLEDHIERQGKQGQVVTGIIKQHRTIKYVPQDGSLLSVVITPANTDKVQRIIDTIAKSNPGAKYEAIFTNSKHDQEYFTPKLKEAANVRVVNNKDLAATITGTSVMVINDEVLSLSDDWARLALADTQINNVGFVYPVLLKEDLATIRSAGLGLGYGPTGTLNMLEDMPLQDDHYTRGLYAKSRRNVSAGADSVYVISKAFYTKYLKDAQTSVDAAVRSLKDGYRHVYTPYIQVSTMNTPNYIDSPRYVGYTDTYLNENFSKDGGRMEVKS